MLLRWLNHGPGLGWLKIEMIHVLRWAWVSLFSARGGVFTGANNLLLLAYVKHKIIYTAYMVF